MKKYMKPSCEVINIVTEGTLAVSGVKTHEKVGGPEQFSQKKSMWDSSDEILGK